ncbi:MAG: glutamate 5-kinase [Oscillospiraceae bacterium]|jgi:glutamate 5-kinase|nr:glutamate 5-kinase [Oscillospiraceae bacterium]
METSSEKKRVVIKAGTSTLAYQNGCLNLRRVEKLLRVLSDLKNSGKEIVFVTSGAVAVGMSKAGLAEKPSDMPGRQACAAIGQAELMNLYDREFAKYNHKSAQILMTRDVISNPERKANITNTFRKLLDMGVIPVVNANDCVSIENLDFDENDTLSAIVAGICGADLLVILTDVDGLFDRDPRLPDAKLIPLVTRITADMLASVGDKGSSLSSGGMLAKLEAARIASEYNVDTIILKGDSPDNLYSLFEGENIGTLFKGEKL